MITLVMGIFYEDNKKYILNGKKTFYVLFCDWI